MYVYIYIYIYTCGIWLENIAHYKYSPSMTPRLKNLFELELNPHTHTRCVPEPLLTSDGGMRFSGVGLAQEYMDTHSPQQLVPSHRVWGDGYVVVDKCGWLWMGVDGCGWM